MTQEANDTQASRLQWLEEQIAKAQDTYYNGEAVMEDGEYDLLVEELAALNSEHPLLVKVGAEPVSEWKKATHKIPMGSLDKVQSIEDFQQWVANRAPGEDLFFAEKLDGISIELLYEDGKLVEAITRGSGTIGEAIIQNVAKMGGVIKQLPDATFTGSLRGEIILTKSKYQQHHSGKSNARNGAAGIAKRFDGEGVEHLDVLLYQALGSIEMKTEEEQFQWLQKMGCQTPNWKMIPAAAAVDDMIKIWEEYQKTTRASLNYNLDGLVIRLNDLTKQRALGEHNMRPKGAVAWKFGNEEQETIIKDVIFQTGGTGRITPIAILEPVVLVGATVERASLYNMAYIDELGIGIGAKVIVVRANDVIPRVQALVSPPEKVITAPKNCPSCQTEILEVGEYLTCPNENCFARVSGRIKSWCKQLNMLELGDKVIDKLIEAGLVETVADLYCLSVKDIANLERLGDKSAENIIKSIWDKATISLDVLLGSLSIPLIGSTTIRLLMAAGYDTLEKINKMSVEEMLFVKGMGNARANSLYQGLIDNAELIEELLENGIQIKGKNTMEEMTTAGKKLDGMSFCFTGTASYPRKELQTMVENHGGTNKSSVSKGLSYLVCNDTGTTKTAKAEKLAVKIISEEQFLEMVGVLLDAQEATETQ
jgi:DNA ligase (NAD+)